MLVVENVLCVCWIFSLYCCFLYCFSFLSTALPTASSWAVFFSAPPHCWPGLVTALALFFSFLSLFLVLFLLLSLLVMLFLFARAVFFACAALFARSVLALSQSVFSSVLRPRPKIWEKELSQGSSCWLNVFGLLNFVLCSSRNGQNQHVFRLLS